MSCGLPNLLQQTRNIQPGAEGDIVKVALHSPMDSRRLVFGGGSRLARQIEEDLKWLDCQPKRKLSRALRAKRACIAYRVLARCCLRGSLIKPKLFFYSSYVYGYMTMEAMKSPHDAQAALKSAVKDVLLNSGVAQATDKCEMIWEALGSAMCKFEPETLVMYFARSWNAFQRSPTELHNLLRAEDQKRGPRLKTRRVPSNLAA